MTIKNKFIFLSLLILILSSIFGYTFWKTSNQLHSQRTANDVIQSIINHTFNFSAISNEYALTQTPRIKSQWNRSHISLEILFMKTQKVLSYNDDKESLKKIQDYELQAELYLAALVSKKNTPSASNKRKLTQTVSQIRIRSQGMLSEASRMSRRSLDRLKMAESQLENSSRLLILIYFSLFMIVLYLINKNIMKPIVDLQENANKLALGDYSSRIPVIRKDEISDLAQSYNTLASEIEKKIHVLTEKSKELTESQKELLIFNENLQSMIDEQTSDLKNSDIKQRTILDSISDGIFTLDSNFTIQEINPAITKIFGYSSQDCHHKKLTMLVSNLKDVIKNSGDFYEKDAYHKNGHTFPIEVSLNRLMINDSVIFSCFIRDITERKRVQKMQVEFVSNVSHELRTPLTSIRGAIGLVKSGVLNDAPEKGVELLETAYNNTERLTLLINDLLDMQKIEAGKLDFNLTKIDLTYVIDQAISDNLSYAEQFNVLIKARESVEDIFIKSDPLRLSQIMSNLLSNSAKFSYENSSIYIDTAIENKHIKISVIDSGEGIPEEYFDHIFEKFTQNDASSTREKGGTGLGLTITKQMIETMGGSIDFTSTLGKGTTFNIYVPIYE